jgi:cysteine sulfinate desulfinase/cysteine desulfurase-like protein
VRLGYSAADGMFRRQVERSLKEAEAAISKVTGAPAGLSIETVTAAESAPSIAEEETERTRAREAKIMRDSREHPAVLRAMKLLGGVVEHIRVLDEEQEEQFAATPEEGDEAGHDEP